MFLNISPPDGAIYRRVNRPKNKRTCAFKRQSETTGKEIEEILGCFTAVIKRRCQEDKLANNLDCLNIHDNVLYTLY